MPEVDITKVEGIALQATRQEIQRAQSRFQAVLADVFSAHGYDEVPVTPSLQMVPGDGGYPERLTWPEPPAESAEPEADEETTYAGQLDEAQSNPVAEDGDMSEQFERRLRQHQET